MSSPLTYDAFRKIAPAAHDALLAMGKSADESGVDKQIIELVKLRVSQINNCAFCLQIHLNTARQLGMPAEKLDLVATWHEAGIFSEKECAALAWAEALADLAGHSVTDADYDAVRKHFSEEEVVFLSVSIANINAWNRLGARLPLRAADPQAGGRGGLRALPFGENACLGYAGASISTISARQLDWHDVAVIVASDVGCRAGHA